MQPEFGFALQYVIDVEAAKAFDEAVVGLNVQMAAQRPSEAV